MTTAFQRACNLYDRGQLREALPLYQQALEEQPGDVEVIYRCCLTLMAMRKYAECASWLSQLIPHINAAETPPVLMSGFHYNLGVAYQASGQWRKSVFHMGKAIEYNPDAVLPTIEMGSLAYRRGDQIAARRWHDRALSMTPDSPDALPALAFVKLLRGDYLGGFKDYETRWKMPQVLATTHIPKDHWRWKGKDLKGKRIVVVSEQGIGDTIQMLRYLPMIEARGGKITLVCQAPLVRLLRHNYPSVDVVEQGKPYRAARWWVSLMSLPYVFGTTLETIPSAARPYLGTPAQPDGWFPYKIRANDATDAEWAAAIVPNVGYLAQGNPLHMADKDRSAPKGAFDALLSTPGVRFTNLDEKRELDFLDLASFLLSLDLVICVDTAVGHLAGALGVPMWLICQTSEWRWGLTDEAPWYRRTHTLYRRHHVNAWTDVISRIRTDLEARCQTRLTPSAS